MQHPKKTIDARLRAAADLALEAVRGITNPLAADVGCDHGYLTAYLLRQRMDIHVVASDISAPSLRKAELLLNPEIYGGRVCFRVADGLASLKPEETPDVIIMAGMGGQLILNMLRAGQERIGGASLVLQANLDIPQLRSGLAEMGYVVRQERYAEAGGRQYAVLLASAGETQKLTEKESLLGNSTEENSAGRMRYLETQRAQRIGEMRKASEKKTEKGLQKMEEAARQAAWIAEELGMKACTVQDVWELVNRIAPFETAEPWDNVGLLLGSKTAPVQRVLVALDVTAGVVEEARKLGCQLILTHHPFMFHAVKRMTDDDREGALMLAMAKVGLSHIAAHTNLDKAPGGVNDTLLAVVGCTDVQGSAFVRVGTLPEGLTFGELSRRVAEALHAQVRTYGAPDSPVHSLGCCSGSGAEEYHAAMEMGADCFLTGEVRHNVALDAVHDGCPIIEAGHYETERPVCDRLTDTLQKTSDELKYNLTFFSSSVDPFGRGV